MAPGAKSIQAELKGDVVIRDGEYIQGKTIYDVVDDLKTGDVMDFVDEGYSGRTALERRYPRVVLGPEFPTTPGTYRDLKREAEKD